VALLPPMAWGICFFGSGKDGKTVEKASFRTSTLSTLSYL
jgi:hypothetical protein